MAVNFVFLEVSNMEVPVNRDIPLDNARLILDRQNEIAKNDGLSMAFEYALKEDGTAIYQSGITLPIDEFSLFKAICEEIEDQEFEGKLELKKWLSVTFKEKVRKVKEPKKPKEKQRRELPVISKKMLLTFFIGLVVLLIGGATMYHFSAAAPIPVQPSFNKLLKQEKFIEAAEEYPDRIDQIENELFDLTRNQNKEYLDTLKDFQESYPTVQGSFDLLMFAFDYKQVVVVFEENTQVFQSDSTRLTLAGYAYLKLDMLDKSKELLEQSNSTELEKLIRQYEQLQLIIEEKEKEIVELQKKPTENKAKIEQAINDLYEAKEELSNF